MADRLVRLLPAIMQAVALVAMATVYLGAVGTEKSEPIDIPGWRTATLGESLCHDIEQRRALDAALNSGGGAQWNVRLCPPTGPSGD